MKVVCVAGMPGCGKEEFLKIAQEKGFSVIRMGDIVREEAEKRGLLMTDRAVGSFADEERKKHDYGIWARRTIPKITGELCLVDGVRGPAETNIYKTAFPDKVFIVAVHASPTTRLRRILTRQRRDDPTNDIEFYERDKRELTWGIADVIALADFMIVNEGELEIMRPKAIEILDNIISEGA